MKRSFCWREFLDKYRFCTDCGKSLAESAEVHGFEAQTGKPQVRMVYTCPEQHMSIYTEPVAVA